MDLAQQLHSRIRESFATAADGRRFVHIRAVAEWLLAPERDHARRIDLIYSALNPDVQSDAVFVIPDVQAKVKLFCILYEIGCVNMFSFFSCHTILDAQLPLSHGTLKRLAESDVSESLKSRAEVFFDAQWSYCPATFEIGCSRAFPPETILPFSRMIPISTDSHAKIYHVTIMKDYLGPSILELLNQANDDDTGHWDGTNVHFVMKTVSSRMADIALNEIRVFQSLGKNENIVRYICDFTFRGEICILLERGKYDLYQYFSFQESPVLRRDIAGFWASLVPAVKGLVTMHAHHSDGEGGECVPGYAGSVSEFYYRTRSTNICTVGMAT